LFLVPLGFLVVFLSDLLGPRLILELGQFEQFDAHFVVVTADVLGLVVGPLIGRFGLGKDLLGVGAMAQERDHRHPNGQHGHRHRHWHEAGMLPCVFRVLLKLVQFVGHEAPFTFSRRRRTSPLTISAVAESEAVPSAQSNVQSATVETSFTKMRLPDRAGAGHVALSATVYVLSASNPPGLLRATISSASSFKTNRRLPARTIAALPP